MTGYSEVRTYREERKESTTDFFEKGDFFMTTPSSDQKGIIFNIARYAIHDGPGIRTTVFLKGCPARCLWCCSPESQGGLPELARKKTLCLACPLCAGEPEKCPGDALERIGREVTASALLREVERDRPFWRRSGGGVTLSGGEPLFQPLFVRAFLLLCRESHIHRAIESCLFFDPLLLDELMDLVDFFQFDLKTMDGEEHRRLTGLDNTVILRNAETLLKSDKPLLVRVPLVPRCNDGETNLRAIGAFVGRHRPGASLEVLPYHRMGAGRYEDLGRTYLLAETEPPPEEEMERVRALLNEYPLRLVGKEG